MNVRTTSDQRRGRVSTVFAAALGAILAAAPALGAVDANQQKKDAATAQQPAVRVEVNAIAANPTPYRGKQVTVVGEVDNILAPGIFRIGSVDEFGPELTVVSVPHATRQLNSGVFVDDDVVTVTGTVVTFTVAEIEREFGLDLDPQIEAEIERVRTILVASSVTPRPNAE
jgi:hypothetical protein